MKTFDYFEVCKLCFKSSCGLNPLLQANNYEVKNSCGTQAVTWARQRNWKPLEEYCLRDARLTYEISTAAAVHVPLTGWNRSNIRCLRRGVGVRADETLHKEGWSIYFG